MQHSGNVQHRFVQYALCAHIVNCQLLVQRGLLDLCQKSLPHVVLLATARQLATPAFATWRSPAGESEIQKRGGETWRSLSKFPRITDISGCIKYCRALLFQSWRRPKRQAFPSHGTSYGDTGDAPKSLHTPTTGGSN